MSLKAYLEALIKAAEQRRMMRKGRIGSGEYQTPQPKSVKYDGAALRAARAQHGVGRPPAVSAAQVVADLGKPLSELVADHGSQRKAAEALGMNLSTFQRALKKEQGEPYRPGNSPP